MNYVPFGRTGVKVSPLTLGCMMFGGKTPPDESARIIDRALDAGINILDTANVYNAGRSEEVTGAALKANGRRARVLLATKVHRPMDPTDPNAAGLSRRHIIAECEASLRRLQTDYIDLYQLHRQQTDTAIDETLRALDDLVRAGKVRYLGTSTWAAWQIAEALWCADRHHLNRFVGEQPPYNLLDRRIERELLPMCRTYGIATIPWSPIAGGLLSGKYRAGEAAAAGTRYADKEKNPLLANRWTDASLAAVEKLLPLAEARHVPLSQLALAWVVQQPGVTSPIVGPRTMEQLEDNLKALELKLSEGELKRIDEIVPPGTHTSPYYEADFGPNQHRW
jgi:aryl-alcohol dehydrogenase-like predicted oxidoreductase